MSWIIKNIFLFSLLFAFCNCVGPTSPFGTVDQSQTQKKRNLAEAESSSPIKILFHPQKQVYHDRSDFSLELKSPIAIDEDMTVEIFHNGNDVTESFLNHAHVHRSTDGKSLIYTIKDLRLKTLDSNDIQVRLKNGKKIVSTKDFSRPDCSFFAKSKLSRSGVYHVPKHYIPVIEKVALQNQANPSFLAGIVAQESAFNPKAVSWAKAIGLTQMTPLAEKQIMSDVENWPRYPGINDLTFLEIKYKISSGDINDNQEWRLNPEMSLNGGMAYLHYLEDYWNKDSNRELIKKMGGDKNKVFTELVLASYNSGAARVKSAVIKSNKNWKNQKNLKEALRYIRKVTSYCYHYSNNEVVDDNET